jgi:DNA polymerase III alpha subunit
MNVRYWEHKNGNFDRGEFPVWLDLKGHVSDFLFDMLEDTYGVPIYQEQTMQMLAEFIGINFEDTNPMRKIIGIPVSKRSKKHFDYLDEQKKKFIENGARLVGEDLARQWWDTAVGSLGYGFNAAHCFSYSTISYWQLWLKCYYPKEYYYSLIKSVVAVSSEKDNRDGGSKLMQYINEAKQLGVDIFAPEVNTSKSVLSLDEANIFIGLSQVKGVGGLAANQIVANQPYSDFNDFLQKNVTKGSKVNKRSIEALLHANAFRKFGEKPEIAQAYAIHRKEEYKPLSNIEYLIKEKDVLTIVLSEQNPIELPYGYRTYEKAINSKNGEYNKIIGIVDSVTGEMTSKNGNKYANIYLTDFEQNIKVFLWSSQFEYLEILKKGYLVKAKLKHMSDDAFMVTNIIDIIDLEDDEDE